MNSKESNSQALYYDALTGEQFATVDRGIWYNQMIFFYLLQKNYRKNAQNQ